MVFKQKFKKGAASFYIVAFSTLILLIIATSFAAVIISELERTSNDDLSQSAYDSAMAGIEDAKLAFYNYQKCASDGGVASDSTPTMLDCSAVMYYMENPLGQDCDMVGHMLGRIDPGESGEVLLEESATSNNMQQAYTCMKMQTVLKDYRATLSSANQVKVVKVKFDNVPAKDIKTLKLSWYSAADTEYQYTNFSDGKVVFPQMGSVKKAVPPTISVALLQTAQNFTLSDFDVTRDGRTDRGMLYLVPMSTKEAAGKGVKDNYEKGYNKDEGKNHIGTEGFSKSNDKTKTNVPYGVYCPDDADTEFACTVTIELPEPINGDRNDDTFMFVVSLPYGVPETDFSMEFYCANECATDKVVSQNEDGETVVTETKSNQASLSGVQLQIDSTGRANDLYRRVETRLEAAADSSYLSLMGPLELLGQSSGSGGGADMLKKIDAVKKEWNFTD